MKPAFRASTAADQPAIALFLQQTFASATQEPYLQPKHMNWKYWQPRPDWPGSRSFLLDRGETLAHGAAWPLRILTPDSAISAFHLIDWAADPKAVGAGVSIMKRMADMAEVICVFGGSDAAKRMRTAMGFRPRNEAQIWVKPLRPWRQTLTHQTHNWKTAARLARNWQWSRKAPRSDARWTAQPMGSEPVPFPQARNGQFVFEQTPAQIGYLLACPTARFQYFTVMHSGLPVGYFCLAFVPAQARLAEAWLASDTPESWNQLVSLAHTHALADSSANELVAQTSSAAMQLSLRHAGFRLHHSDHVLVYDPKGRIPEPASLDLQMIHGDMAFWHPGRPLYLS